MRTKLMLVTAIALVSFLSVSGFSKMGMGQGPGRDGDGVFEPGEGPMMMHGKGMGSQMHEMMLPNPEAQAIAEKYRVKMQKIFLDSKETRLPLNAKRRELVQKLDELAEKYAKDKAVAKDIVAATRELRVIQDKVRDINQAAMEKIKALNDEREKEMTASMDAWLKKIESDPAEMEKYVKWVNEKPAFDRMGPDGMGGRKGGEQRNAPRDAR